MQNRIDSGFTDLNFATKSVHDSQEKLVLQQVTRVSRNFIQTEVGIIASSGTQGQSVGSGKKARRKFSSTGEKAPGYRLSPSYFQNFKRMPAPDWAQKVFCVIVPNRRTVSPEFFSWVRTRQLLSRHTYPVRSPSLCVQGELLFSTFPTRNEGTTDESKKRLGCYQQEQLNLPREYCVFDGSQSIVNNRKFKMRRRRETRQNNNFARASRFFLH